MKKKKKKKKKKKGKGRVMANSAVCLMRLLVIDSSDAGNQRSPGILAPDVLQPFLRRCTLLGHLGDIANPVLTDIGID